MPMPKPKPKKNDKKSQSHMAHTLMQIRTTCRPIDAEERMGMIFKDHEQGLVS